MLNLDFSLLHLVHRTSSYSEALKLYIGFITLITFIISSNRLYALGASSRVSLFTEIVYTPDIVFLYSSKQRDFFAFVCDMIRSAPCGAE